MKKILVYPFYSNPYQSLLYKEIKNNKDIEIKYLSDDISRFGGYILMAVLPYYLLKNRLLGFTIFHLHWVMFTPLSQSKVVQSISLVYVLFIIIFIKLIRYKLVWTIHNILPHNTLTANDMFITKFLCKVSDAKIVHSQFTVTELENSGCDIHKITIIPHGNYISSYENRITKREARNFLEIEQQAFVFLFFGEIKLYKGIDDLLKAFKSISSTYKHVTLIIAGKVYEPSIQQLITDYSSELGDKVTAHLRHIKDKEIQYFMNAANVVVYPFKKITTSGSVLLALSFGKSIIYPKLGALQELHEAVGFPYESSDSDGLLKSMQRAIASDKAMLPKEKVAYTYAKSLSWNNIAEQTIAVYYQL
ncbi:MAG TPA: glycosyltransferase [Candidatus Saccharimonadales bacterium]|nr:glycosyltransferase [Candidatus Saccharimonadales bacterium]